MRRSPNSPWRRNPALRLVLKHAGLGALLGLAFAAALILVDAHGLGSLITSSDSGVVAFALLAGGFMVTFGSLVAGGAVMLIGGEDDDRPDRGLGAVLVPVPVRARRRPPVQHDRY